MSPRFPGGPRPTLRMPSQVREGCGRGAGAGPGWGHLHSVLSLPIRSLPWASPAPSPSSLAPWSPPLELRVSREAPAAVPPPANQDPRTRTTPAPTQRVSTLGNGPGLSLLFLLPPGHSSMGPMQRVTPPRGMTSVGPQVRAGPGDWEHQGLPPLNLHSWPLCLRRATEEVACGPHPTLLLALACPP